ncbi:MAG: MFS transporter [Desulfobacterales bacterium]|nr:MFS transporter [Desulfobacterales bacterium]
MNKDFGPDRGLFTRTNTIPLGMKFGYGVGDFANNMGFQVGALFLIYFFTDVFNIPAAAAGSIFLVSKLWDAVSDPLMGIISDRTTTRWGRLRPYLLFGSIPLGLSVFLLFLGPDLSENAKVFYGYASFIFFCTAITVVNVPYGAMTADLTMDFNERSTLTGYRQTFGLLGTLVAAGATKPLVALFPDEATGFRMVGLLYGIIIAVIILVTFSTVKERGSQIKGAPQSFAKNLKVITSNHPFIILSISTTLYMVAINLMAAVVNYYFKYNLQAESFIPIAFLALFVTAALCMPLYVYISNRTSKKFTSYLGMSILGIMLLAIFFFGEKSLMLTLGFFVIAGMGIPAFYQLPWSMVPDTVEYSQWKTGLRREGTLYGCYFFCFKFGSAISGFLAGWGLDGSGYVANVEQSEQALMAIRSMVTIVPLFFIILGMIALVFFPINEAMHRKIVEELSSRS